MILTILVYEVLYFGMSYVLTVLISNTALAAIIQLITLPLLVLIACCITRPLLIKEIFFSIFEGLYAKKMREAMFKAKNFLRPIGKQQMGTYVFANRNCIVELNDMAIYCYDKGNNHVFTGTIFKQNKKKILLDLCEIFSFDINYLDILNFIKSYENKNLVNATKEENTSYKIKIPSLNNMSIAELICLPGINMGKAYKIHKYLRTNDFKSVKHFINFADISTENKNKICNTKYLYFEK